jgi:hypothetical protein
MCGTMTDRGGKFKPSLIQCKQDAILDFKYTKTAILPTWILL